MNIINKQISELKKTVKKELLYNNPYYLSYFKHCEKFWNGFPSNLDVVNLGSNTALFGFRYEGLPVNAANWALSPQSLNQDLAILKTYYGHIRPRGTIIVPLGPYSSCYKNYTDTEWLKYFTIIDPTVNERFSEEKQMAANMLKNKPYTVARKQMLYGILQYLKNSLHSKTSPFDYTSCPMSDEQIEKNAQLFIECWKKQFKIEDMNSDRPEHINRGRELRISTLKEIIKFCKDRELRMFVVLPPITKALSNYFSSAFKENYIYSFLRDTGLSDNLFLNYLDDSRFQKNELFFNSLFLNKTGGRLFTNQVMKDINILE